MTNSNQITTDQTMNLLSSINYEIMEAEKKNDQSKKVSGQKTVDVMSTAGTTQISKSKVSGTEKTPQLPAPSRGDSGGGLVGSGASIVSIIGAILMLQAQASSNFYALQWDQGTQMMGLEIELAPVISDATIASANSNAAATQAQANEALVSGILNAIGAVAVIGLSVTSIVSELNTVANAGKALGQNAAKASEDLINEAEKDVSALEGGAVEAAETAGNAVKNSIGKSIESGLKALSSSAVMSGVQGINIVVQAGTGFTGFYFKGIQADAQAQAGQYDATSKVAEQLTKFFDQGYNRTSEMNQETSQAFNTTTQTLDSIISISLQGVQKLFS